MDDATGTGLIAANLERERGWHWEGTRRLHRLRADLKSQNISIGRNIESGTTEAKRKNIRAIRQACRIHSERNVGRGYSLQRAHANRPARRHWVYDERHGDGRRCTEGVRQRSRGEMKSLGNRSGGGIGYGHRERIGVKREV